LEHKALPPRQGGRPWWVVCSTQKQTNAERIKELEGKLASLSSIIQHAYCLGVKIVRKN